MTTTDFDQSPHDDAEFTAAWIKMEERGYQWSESNIEKAHLGWLMARATPPAQAEASTLPGEVVNDLTMDVAKVAERIFDFANEHILQPRPKSEQDFADPANYWHRAALAAMNNTTIAAQITEKLKRIGNPTIHETLAVYREVIGL